MNTITMDYNEFKTIQHNADKNNIKKDWFVQQYKETIASKDEIIKSLENKLSNNYITKMEKELYNGVQLLKTKTETLEKEYIELNKEKRYYNENTDKIFIKYFILSITTLFGIIGCLLYLIYKFIS